MIAVLALAGLERLVNVAIDTSPLAKTAFAPLLGKVLRLVIHKADTPAHTTENMLAFDILFCGDLNTLNQQIDNAHVRFEPIKQQIFEPQGIQTIAPPDCTLSIAGIGELIELLKQSIDDPDKLNIIGDSQVFIDTHYLLGSVLPSFVLDAQALLHDIFATSTNTNTNASTATAAANNFFEHLKNTLTHLNIINIIQPNDNALNQSINQKTQQLDALSQQIAQQQHEIQQLKEQLQHAKNQVHTHSTHQ
ncbi:MAG: hypothetical protein Q4G13_02325 [Moraxella sp.]|nr:hypothetical protein [Moraxella sp.]